LLDVAPVLPVTRARPDRSVERVIAERGWIAADDLERLTGRRHPPVLGRWVVSGETLAAASAALRVRVESAGPLGLDVASLTERDRAVLGTLADVVVTGGRARPAGRADPLADHPYLAAVAAAPFAPPAPDEASVDRRETHELVRRGLVVEQDGIYFAPDAVRAAGEVVARLLADRPEGVTVSEVRAALGTSRKFAVPMLNRLDADGVTRRRGDVRVAGPRLPVVD
jgi:selenocysteine-specific elongation factor